MRRWKGLPAHLFSAAPAMRTYCRRTCRKDAPGKKLGMAAVDSGQAQESGHQPRGAPAENALLPAHALAGRGLGESRLRVALDVLQMKAKHGWTDTSVEDILEYVKDLLPAGNTCPGSLAEAKRITCPLDLPHEKYHARINDCIMYRKEHMDKTKCPVCEAERYKKGKKKAPRKVVWYFPPPGFNGSTRTARKQSSCAGTQKERRQC
ncbi:hypothetical protein QYE76_038736 [Lolium multiflorum]|uniref:Uncharacterized protein n=1 Tax=Lolium multiflorum TaxID=4521 RepID=A0AAD8TA27_LOLMU|nr:hypothetical protein QYE76_038736 [Lolium multiflorum]